MVSVKLLLPFVISALGSQGTHFHPLDFQSKTAHKFSLWSGKAQKGLISSRMYDK